jgi:predicted MPP superfamily phosphohydrolase
MTQDNREYGIYKHNNEYIITDLLKGLSITLSSNNLKTLKKAKDYLYNFKLSASTNDKQLKTYETDFEKLEAYNFDKVYITHVENRDYNTSNVKGEYKDKKFEITITHDNYEYKLKWFEGDFTEQEIEFIGKDIYNKTDHNRKLIKLF